MKGPFRAVTEAHVPVITPLGSCVPPLPALLRQRLCADVERGTDEATQGVPENVALDPLTPWRVEQ